MKKVLKSRIFVAIITAIIVCGISVYATIKLTASEVSYSNTTVKSALDTLYSTQTSTVANLNNQITTLTNANATLTDENTTLTNANTTLTSQYNSLLADYTDNLSGTNIYSNSSYTDTRGTSNQISVQLPTGKYVCNYVLTSSAVTSTASQLVDSTAFSDPTVTGCNSSNITTTTKKRQSAKENNGNANAYHVFHLVEMNFICEVTSTKTITINTSSSSATNQSPVGKVIVCNKIK